MIVVGKLGSWALGVKSRPLRGKALQQVYRICAMNGWGIGSEKPTVGSVYLDYDSTITRWSSIRLQLAVIAKDAAQRDAGEGVTEERAEAIAKITADFAKDFDQMCRHCLSLESRKEFDWELVHRINEEMNGFEKKWNAIVEDSMLLQGVQEETFLCSAKETELQPGAVHAMSGCLHEGISLKILSVNWSEKWIRRSIRDQSPRLKWVQLPVESPGYTECSNRTAFEKEDPSIQVYANELEYKDGVSTGRLLKCYGSISESPMVHVLSADRRTESGKDKANLMKSLLGGHSNGLSVYVGDSVIDLGSLLLADIGIVLGNDKTLLSFLEHCRIQMQSIETANLTDVSDQKTVTGSKNENPLLLMAQSWDAISQFLLGSEKQKVPRVLIVAGSDSGGGAGIQADLKTVMANGAFGTTAITAVTSQNTYGVQRIHPVPCEHIESQMDSVLSDIGADVVKIGMLPSAEVVHSVANKLVQHGSPPVVVDPVMVSTSGDTLAGANVAMAIVQKLFPLALVVCPNIPEAEMLSGLRITSVADMKKASELIQTRGPKVVVIKGGHLESGATVHDVVCDGSETRVSQHPRIQTNRMHGTGCTVASAIASRIAQGWDPIDAVELAVQYVGEALRNSVGMDVGHGMQLPFHHGYRWYSWPSRPTPKSKLDLSLYAITDHSCNKKHHRDMAEAIEQALAGGATVLQVREKDSDGQDFLESVKIALEVAAEHGIPVIVNDRVDVAIAADADGVHLGQEDLPAEAVRKMIGPDTILGVSAKTVEQAAAAEEQGADYIGVGAVYPTQSKSSSVIGLGGLRQICEAVSIPVVAIGGISESNVEEAMSAGAKGVAVVSAIFDSSDVRASTAQLRSMIEKTKTISYV